MKIDIVGWFGPHCKNVGDESFKYFHQECFGHHDIRYVTPPETCRESTDMVVLGGGAVVAPFYLDTLPKDKPKYALGVDISYESEIDLLTAAKFQGVMVRNATDLPAMQQKLDCPVTSIPDLAFCIPFDYYEGLRDRKMMGVLVTDYVNPAIDRPIDQFAARAWDFKLKMAKRLDSFIRRGWLVHLIPCSTGGYGNDLRINLDLMAFMKEKPICIGETLTPPEMMTLLSRMDINICMKFHAHIFSVMAGSPFVSIEFTRKVKLFLEENNLTELSAARFEGDVFTENLELAVEAAIQSNQYEYRFRDISTQNLAKLQLAMQQVRRDWLKE